MTRVFLSYGRADDEPFVSRLYETLKRHSFEVWWDREHMPSRTRTFLQEIRDEIDRTDRLVLVLGPNAVASDYVRAEWQYALVTGKVLTPILRLGKYDLIPPELRNLPCPEARKRRPWNQTVKEILRILREEVPPLGALHGSLPGPPAHFQPRPTEMSSLAEKVLLDTKHPVVLEPWQRTTVLWGMGGSGKSVLASAFARSTETRRAFGSGIFWLAAAKSEEEALQQIRRVAQNLGDDLNQYKDPEMAWEALRKALSEVACLVVLDNAADQAQLEPFRDAMGPRSRLLITTREGGLASSLGAAEQRLGVLDEGAALRHLADWSGRTDGRLPEEAVKVAERCGRLPFALALAGAMVADGVPWTDLLDKLEKADLTFMEKRFPNYREYENILECLQVSVDSLTDSDASLYRELAVFTRGTSIPESAVTVLWGHTSSRDEADCRKLLAKLDRKALIRLEGSHPQRKLLIHDLQQDHLLATTEDITGLHGALVDAYAARAQPSWSQGPNDGYFFEHLGDHLLQAKRKQELYKLIDKSWMEAQFSHTSSHLSFTHDVQLSINLAGSESPPRWDRLVRGALIQATLGDLSTHVPSRAIGVLTSLGRVTEARGYAALTSTEKRREAYGQIALALLEQGKQEEAGRMIDQVLVAADLIDDPASKAYTLSWACQALARAARKVEAEQTASQALRLARRLQNPKWKTVVLLRTAETFNSLGNERKARQLHQRAIRAATAIEVEKPSQLNDLVVPLCQLNDPSAATGILADNIKKLKSRGYQFQSQRYLIELLSCQAESCISRGQIAQGRRLARRALALSRKIQDKTEKALALSWTARAFARLNQGDEVVKIVEEALGATQKIRFWDEWVLLANVLPVLFESKKNAGRSKIVRRLKQIIESAKGPSRMRCMTALAEIWLKRGEKKKAEELIDQVLEEAVDPTVQIASRQEALALQGIARELAQTGDFDRAWSVVGSIEDSWVLDQVHGELALILADRQRGAEALEAAQKIESSYHRNHVLLRLSAIEPEKVSRLSPKLLPLVDVLTASTDESAKDRVQHFLVQLLGHPQGAGILVPSLVQSGFKVEAAAAARLALQAAGSIENQSERARSLGDLAQSFVLAGDEQGVDEILATTGNLKDDGDRASLLSRVVLALAESGKIKRARRLANEAVAAAEAIREGRWLTKADALGRLARALFMGRSMKKAVRVADRALQNLEHAYGMEQSGMEDRATQLAQMVEIQFRAEGLERAIASVEKLRHDPDKSTALGAISQRLAEESDEGSLDRLQDVARSISGRASRAEAICSVSLARANSEDALNGVRDAFFIARQAGRPGLFRVLELAAPMLAQADQGETLWALFQSTAELKTWWVPRQL